MMFESSAELAENKLLVMYTLFKIDRLISNTQLTEILLKNNLINYFTLQQCISELHDSEFLHYEKVNDKNLLKLTEKGENVLLMFKERISNAKIEIIDNHIRENIESIKKELTIQSDYTPSKNNSFIAELKAFEDDCALIDLKISVPNKKQAVSLCSRWKKNPSKIYNDIIKLLFAEEES